MMIYSCFPSLDQAQEWINMYVCVFLVCSAEQGKKTRREREIGKRGERKSWEGKGHWEQKWEMGNNGRKTKEINELV